MVAAHVPDLDAYVAAKEAAREVVLRAARGGGLITPYRPMTIEAAAGKNPVSHVGKLYSVVATRAAQAIAALGDVDDVDCLLVSRIGQPIDEPCLVHVRLAGGDPPEPAVVERLVRDELARFPLLQEELLAGTVPLY